MRYIRFLKTPRIVRENKGAGAHVFCLITITSDLGDSFLPHKLTLSAELIQNVPISPPPDPEAISSATSDADEEELWDITDNITVWKTVQWTEGMRSLPVTLPLSRNYKRTGPCIVRIGTEPKSQYDQFDKLLQGDTRGVVSAWSAPFNLDGTLPDSSLKIVERRFRVGPRTHKILEESGESIARHLWDAGVTLSCHWPFLLADSNVFDKAFERVRRRQAKRVGCSPAADLPEKLQVVELGAGCGFVSIALSRTIPQVDLFVTDLAEAYEVLSQNLRRANKNCKREMGYWPLDWEVPLGGEGNWLFCEDHGDKSHRNIDLVVAADCTYNADTSPSFVNTIRQIAIRSPEVTVVVAMKRRHPSEDVFFQLMSDAMFRTVNTICFPLPGDEEAGEESVELYVYEYFGMPTEALLVS